LPPQPKNAPQPIRNAFNRKRRNISTQRPPNGNACPTPVQAGRTSAEQRVHSVHHTPCIVDPHSIRSPVAPVDSQRSQRGAADWRRIPPASARLFVERQRAKVQCSSCEAMRPTKPCADLGRHGHPPAPPELAATQDPVRPR
jgi:hypothetical protein